MTVLNKALLSLLIIGLVLFFTWGVRWRMRKDAEDAALWEKVKVWHNCVADGQQTRTEYSGSARYGRHSRTITETIWKCDNGTFYR